MYYKFNIGDKVKIKESVYPYGKNFGIIIHRINDSYEGLLYIVRIMDMDDEISMLCRYRENELESASNKSVFDEIKEHLEKFRTKV